MGYNPFDFIGTDKRQKISAKATDVASGIVNESKLNKLKEIIRGMVREAIKGHKSEDIPYIGKYDKDGKEVEEDLRKWFKDKWVNIGKKDKSGKHPPCGTSGKTRAYAKCVPKSKAASMSKKQKASATRRKRAAQNKAGRGGTSSTRGGGKKPMRVSTKPKK